MKSLSQKLINFSWQRRLLLHLWIRVVSWKAKNVLSPLSASCFRLISDSDSETPWVMCKVPKEEHKSLIHGFIPVRTLCNLLRLATVPIVHLCKILFDGNLIHFSMDSQSLCNKYNVFLILNWIQSYRNRSVHHFPEFLVVLMPAVHVETGV